MKPISTKLLLALSMSFASAAASAAEDWNCDLSGSSFSSCYYLGAGVGVSKLKPAENNDWSIDSGTDTAMQIYGGYHITKDWFVDIAYADLGKADMQNANPNVHINETIDYKVASAMAGYYLNFFDLPIEPFVRFGLASISNSASSNIEVDKQHDVGLAWGAGLDWRFAKHFKLRGAVETYDKDASLVSVSVAYIFGEAKVAPKPIAAPKAEPKPEPQPEPVAEVKPEPVVETETAEVKKLFSGSLTGVNFKSGSAELLPESKKILSDAATVLNEYPEMLVDINAYTCNDGSKEFNVKLSQKRAESVKNFFVSQGVEVSRLKATGYGKENPILPNTSEANKAKNRRVELKHRSS